jgi:carbonic anhydrase
MAADAGIDKLIEGNKRFVAGNTSHPRQDHGRRNELSAGQNPHSCILSCADSRVPPEIIFDQGLGDLFVLRVAGNIVNDMILGSLEYAVEHLGSALIVVLGHQRCGAVGAAVSGGKLPGNIQCLADAIHPAVEQSKNDAGDHLDNAVKQNITLSAQNLLAGSTILDEFVKSNKLQIAKAYYELDSGQVHWL